MCLYVTYPLELEAVPNTIAPEPGVGVESDARLFRYPYSTSKDYKLAENAMPNGLYAVNGPHPSEMIIGSRGEDDAGQAEANDLPDAHFVRLDSSIRIGTPAQWGSSAFPIMTKHMTNLFDEAFIGASTQSHHYSYATCENLGKCSAVGMTVGSKCSLTQHNGNVLHGFCYMSHKSTLECGRSIFTDSRFGNKPKTMPQPSRCPAGTPLDYAGRAGNHRAVARSLLVGGCMIASDANFRPTAEVHVPQDCAVPKHYKPGCLMPGALNYAPGSLESAKCLYKLNGCTDAGALNYNAEASDDDGSCIASKPGCTLNTASYAPNWKGEAVDPSTPKYQGLAVGLTAGYGSSDVNEGYYVYKQYGNVKKHDKDANVNVGCEIIIEGCMDVNSVNYDAKANTNTNTWCIPKVTGCMMPPPEALHLDEGMMSGRPHTLDGGAGNYDPSATVNDKSMCKVGRVGCSSLTALNYDPLATVPGVCFEPIEACLDRNSLNYNCTESVGFTSCDTPPTWPAVRGTVHSDAVCRFTLFPPPAPAPQAPWGKPSAKVASVEFLVPGAVEDYTEEDKRKVACAFATAWKVPCEKVYVYLYPGSAIMDVQTEVTSDAESTGLLQAVSAYTSSPSALNAYLVSQGVPNKIKVISTPILATQIVGAVTPPAPPPYVQVGAIVGGVIGGIAGVCLIAGLVYVIRKKKTTATTYPA